MMFPEFCHFLRPTCQKNRFFSFAWIDGKWSLRRADIRWHPRKRRTVPCVPVVFEYDEEKNLINLEKHGISLRNAALVFFDYDRIEYFDETHSDIEEDRYNTIGSVNQSMIGAGNKGGILFVVYTERTAYTENDKKIDVTRLISARKATGFEKGLYYGKYN